MQEKDISGIFYHVTCVLYNSRISQRMIDLDINTGEPLCLDMNEEEQFVKICCEVITEDKMEIYALNSCEDHIHLLMRCEAKNLSRQVGRFKSKSARAFNSWLGLTEVAIKKDYPHQTVGDDNTRGHAPLSWGLTQNQLWAQKFNRKKISNHRQLQNTIRYIENNRTKHQLPEFSELTRRTIKSVLQKL